MNPCYQTFLRLLLSIACLISLVSCKTGEKKINLWPRWAGSGITGTAPAQHMLEARRDTLVTRLSQQQTVSVTTPVTDDNGVTKDVSSSYQTSHFQYRYELARINADERNNLIWDLIQIADVNYQLYEQGLLAKIQGGNALINIGVAGMNAASTLAGSTGVKTTISTLTTFITGSQAEINKTLFKDMAIQTMISNMRAMRAKKYKVILVKLRKYGSDASKYPIGEAMKDVLEYYQAGTVISATIESQNSAASAQKEAEETTDAPEGDEPKKKPSSDT